MSLNMENSDLKAKIENLNQQVKEKEDLTKELKEAKQSMLDISV